MSIAAERSLARSERLTTVRIARWVNGTAVSRRLRIGHVVGSPSVLGGGATSAARGLCRALQRRDDTEAAVIGAEPAGLPDEARNWAPVPVETVRSRGPSSFRYAPEVVSRLHGGNFDIGHCHLLWTYLSIACRRWGQESRRPYVISTHGMLDGWALRDKGWTKRVARALFEDATLAGAACLHALNDNELGSIRALGLANPVAVVPNGIDLPDLAQVPPAPPWIAGRPRTLLFLGLLHRGKGLAPLLDAFAAATAERRRGPSTDWQLVIAGWDQNGFRRELEASAATLGIAERVRFVGELHGDAKDAAFRAADAFVLPSLSETQPTAVLEAWSYGLPVLMTRACNLSEGFAAGAAIEVKSDAVSLAGALRALFRAGVDDLATMGANGRRLVEARHSWEGTAARMREVYRWMADGGARPDDVVVAGAGR